MQRRTDETSKNKKLNITINFDEVTKKKTDKDKIQTGRKFQTIYTKY